MITSIIFDKYEFGEKVDEKLCQGIIDNLLYFTVIRLDIFLSIGISAGFRSNPKISH